MTTLGEKLREALDKNEVIKKTLDVWDTHEEQIRKPQQEKQMETQQPAYNFAVSNNVMRSTFDAVKNAPKMTHKEYVEMLRLNGFKETSTSAVLYQLIRAGQVVKDEHGQLSVTQDEYTPLKPVKSTRKYKTSSVVVVDKAPEQKPRQIVLVKRGKNSDQGIAALKADTVVKADGGPYEFAKPKAFYPSAIVDNLSVLHARELYDYLKKIFGGN